MNSSAPVTRGRPDAEPLHTVQLPGVKTNLLFRHGDLDVLISDIEPNASIADESLGGGFSWHLVVGGRALFQQGDMGWEVLPAHSLRLPGSLSYRLINFGGEPLRLLSILVGPATAGEHAAAQARP
jgi:hypothetical protein